MSDKYCVLQDDTKDCGVCSLLSIIKYYNGDISKEYLREITKTTDKGVSALNILNGARELGFEAYGIRSNIKIIDKKVLPIIAHVIIEKKYPHFIVVYKIDLNKNTVLVMDPAKGFVNYSISNFDSISTNTYLILKPKRRIPKILDNSDYFKKIKSMVLNYKFVITTVTLISIIYTVVNIIESYHFQIMYNELNDNLDLIVIFLFSLIIIKCFIEYFRNNLISLFNIIFDKTIVKDAFYHIINLPYLYYSNHTNGDLLKRISDLGNIKQLISNFIVCIFVDLFLAVIITFFMLKISISLSIIIIISLFLYGAIIIFNRKSIKEVIRCNYEKAAIVNNYLVESLTSFETIKNFSIQQYIFKLFVRKYSDYNEVVKILYKRVNIQKLFQHLFISFGNILVIYYGVKMINNGTLMISALITFLSLSNYLITPVKNIIDMYLDFLNTKESIRRIKELYHIPKENKLTSVHRIDKLTGDIYISNVSYSYNGIDKIINGISLEIKDGEKVLLYGNSGCGKSTLMRLLIKYIDTNYSGLITIGGFDLKDIDIFSLRKNICYVSQNEYLYTDSIYENITLGKDIKYSDFLKITKNVFVDEIIKNSTIGYNYVIENNGENISGGEKERIVIARSILRKANIYIYDESFSEIDIEKERCILKYLFDMFPTKTFIIISHRLSNEDLFNKKIRIGGEKYEFIK